MTGQEPGWEMPDSRQRGITWEWPGAQCGNAQQGSGPEGPGWALLPVWATCGCRWRLGLCLEGYDCPATCQGACGTDGCVAVLIVCADFAACEQRMTARRLP
jgi:hypothetical protein